MWVENSTSISYAKVGRQFVIVFPCSFSSSVAIPELTYQIMIYSSADISICSLSYQEAAKSAMQKEEKMSTINLNLILTGKFYPERSRRSQSIN